jgi:hypothetical protein
MRAFRLLTVWLMIVAGSGSGPVAALCVERASETRCTDFCTRCWCKRHSPGVSFRAPCPCCQPSQEVAPVTLLPRAVMPDKTPALAPPPSRAADGVAATRFRPFAHPVPHPPPRTHLPS